MNSPKPGRKEAPLKSLMKRQGVWLWALHLLQEGAPKRLEYPVAWEKDGERWNLQLGKQVVPKLSPQPEMIGAILSARNAKGLHRAWESSKLLAEMFERAGKTEADYAKAVLAAKQYEFPSSSRPSSEEKKLFYLSAAMASAECGIRPATAIRKLRKAAKRKHGKRCPCGPCRCERWETFVEESSGAHQKWGDEMQSHPPIGMLLYVPK